MKDIWWPVIVPALLFAIAIGTTTPILIIAGLQAGGSQPTAAAIVALMGVASLICTVPAGNFIDRVGDARAMVVASLAAIVVTGITVVALMLHSLPLYALGLFLRAPIQDLWNLARQAFVATVLPPEDLGRGMTALGGTMRVGNLLGPMVSAGLLYIWPVWSVFVFSALCALAAIIVLQLPAARAFEDVAGIGREKPSSADKKSDTHPPLSQLDIRWNAVILSGISVITLGLARSAMPAVVQLWGVELGLHKSTISLIIALGAAVELCLMIPGAFIKDRMGRATTLCSCLSIFGLGLITMVLIPTASGLWLSMFIMALGNGLGTGINMTIGADLSPTEGRAKFLGVWALFNTVGLLGGPSLISALVALATLHIGVLSCGGLAVFGAAWMFLWRNQIKLPKKVR
ncbi:MFS transporter [Corynebacterium poyangense]|uniref:MFS transporter n=1 Tax=Corynebacterium poyangense TaxID=2684405 RepID=A0A7H0SN44_9CORY|nr:MFS transporter [Corynebacterium poyangense]QNQ89969.1 MFS transporter [Corynebacterium poyangense]